MRELFVNDYVLMAIIIAFSLIFGWIMGKYGTEMKMRREQLRREQELQRLATFADFISSLQGGQDGR